MQPVEALMDAIGRGVLMVNTRRHRNPGDIIKAMSPEHREVLSELTSGDVAKVRLDLLWGDEKYEQRQRISKELVAFDRKLKS